MINVECFLDALPLAQGLIEHAARAALSHEAVHGDLTVVLSDDAQLHELNRAYLGVDAPTDVLSFPASETDPETGARYLGDILVSIPRAGEQARAAGHPLETEVQLLVIHGVLHLLGYDHAEPSEKSKMWNTQQEILESVGLSGIVIRDS